MKTGTLGHVKTRRLKRLLGCPLYQAAGVLECIWHLAAECADEGNVGKYSNEELADYLEWDGDANKLVDSLVAAGFLDIDDQHRLVVHDWADHAPQYIRERIKKRGYRERKQRTYDEKTGDTPGTSEGRPGTDGGHIGTSEGPAAACPLYSQPNQTQPTIDSSLAEKQRVEPPVLEFPTDGDPKTWALTQSQVDEWAGLYPGLDILTESRKAMAWVKANRRKTARGMKRFLVGWLNRANDSGREKPANGTAVREAPSRRNDALEAELARDAQILAARAAGDHETLRRHGIDLQEPAA